MMKGLAWMWQLSQPLFMYVGLERIASSAFGLFALVWESFNRTTTTTGLGGAPGLGVAELEVLVAFASATVAMGFCCIVTAGDAAGVSCDHQILGLVGGVHVANLLLICLKIEEGKKQQVMTYLAPLLVTFNCLAISYFFYSAWYTKAASIWLLAIHLALSVDGKTGGVWCFVCGLLLSSVGDILLELVELSNSNSQLFFVAGLAAFLVAHVLYTAGFWLSTAKKSQLLHAKTISVASPMLGVVYAVLLYVLVPRLPSDLIAPVVVYGLAISLMCLFAVNKLLVNGASQSTLLAVVGAVVFMVSDILIAVNKFVLAEPFQHAKLYIMITYYVGQCCIAVSLAWPQSSEGLKFRQG